MVQPLPKAAPIVSLSSGKARTLHLCKLFQSHDSIGNSISIYGTIIGSEKDISITLDNQTQTLDFALRPPNGGPIWSKAGLTEADHQLLVSHCDHCGHGPHQTAGQPGVPESALDLDYILWARS